MFESWLRSYTDYKAFPTIAASSIQRMIRNGDFKIIFDPLKSAKKGRLRLT